MKWQWMVFTLVNCGLVKLQQQQQQQLCDKWSRDAMTNFVLTWFISLCVGLKFATRKANANVDEWNWQVTQIKQTTSAFCKKKKQKWKWAVNDFIFAALSSQDNSCSLVLLWCNLAVRSALLRTLGIWCLEPRNKSLLLHRLSIYSLRPYRSQACLSQPTSLFAESSYLKCCILVTFQPLLLCFPCEPAVSTVDGTRARMEWAIHSLIISLNTSSTSKETEHSHPVNSSHIVTETCENMWDIQKLRWRLYATACALKIISVLKALIHWFDPPCPH